jgi:hypothetical protein
MSKSATATLYQLDVSLSKHRRIGIVTRNAAGQTQHVVASYRPRTSLLLFARLLAEKFAGSPIGAHFAASES